MCAAEILYLSRRDVESIQFEMKEMVDILSRAFQAKGEGKLEMPPKPGVHPRPDSSIRAMLAYLPTFDAVGVKWIAGYGHNYKKGLPNINGVLVLNDPETGLPQAMMDCTWITAQRTGASFAIAAEHLAKPDSKSLAIVACGQVGRANLEAIVQKFELEEIRAFDINPENAEKFADEMGEKLNISIQAMDDIQKTLKDIEMVVTSGPIHQNPQPVISSEWLRPDGFYCSLDFDSYFCEDVFKNAKRLVTDDVTQLDYYRSHGYFQRTPKVDEDLGEVVAGVRPTRGGSPDASMCVNLGIAMHDVAVGSAIYKEALKQDIGTRLPL